MTESVPTPGPIPEGDRIVTVELPLHYAAIVKRTLETTLSAKGLDGARILTTILDAFELAVGSYQLHMEEDLESDD